MFKDLNLKDYYNTDEDDVVNEFYVPIFSKAKLYKRAAGFFSSSSFLLLIEGLREFLNKDGKIELLISPNLSKEDVEAISLGYKAKEEVVENYFLDKFDLDDQFMNQYNLLSWLIYEEKLDIRIVLRRDFSTYGIFHDKFGIVYSESGEEKISFHGSMNESETAIIDNYESINIFFSWRESDKARVNRFERSFETIWNDKAKSWATLDFPESVKRKLLEIRSAEKPSSINLENRKRNIVIPNIDLRDYQKVAIQNWFNNKCRGIFEMATGTGKTLTALFAVTKLLMHLLSKDVSCGLVMVVPYKNLLDQWCEDLELFNIKPIKCYESKNMWYNDFRRDVLDFNSGTIKNLFVITTNATFISESFQKNLNKIQRHYILCCDEMHHLTGDTILNSLPNNADFALGLTATLENKYEQGKVKRVKEFFNGVVYQFELRQAIEEGFLTPYYYYPVFVELTADEKERYFELSRKIARLYFADEEGEIVKRLLNERGRIIFNAENKISKLVNYKDFFSSCSNTIVYCGDSIDEAGRFIEKVNRTLAFDFGVSTHTYTSQETSAERKNILNMFKNKELQVLTAIKCLDEGVNMPELLNAFILSSTADSKQFIQRRGRILRRAEGKRFANIYDFIVVPTLDDDEIKNMSEDELGFEKKILSRELERFFEFASLSENKVDAYDMIMDIMSKYKIGR